jgi:hypothetical protein
MVSRRPKTVFLRFALFRFPVFEVSAIRVDQARAEPILCKLLRYELKNKAGRWGFSYTLIHRRQTA